MDHPRRKAAKYSGEGARLKTEQDLGRKRKREGMPCGYSHNSGDDPERSQLVRLTDCFMVSSPMSAVLEEAENTYIQLAMLVADEASQGEREREREREK